MDLNDFQNNLAKFNTLTPEQQKIFQTFGINNCEYLSNCGKWINCNIAEIEFKNNKRYRINPDLSIKRYKIINCNNDYIYTRDGLNYELIKDSRVKYFSTFLGFEFKNGNLSTENYGYVLNTLQNDKSFIVAEYILFKC